MKTSNKLVLASALAMMLSSAAIYAQPSPGDEGGPQNAGGPPPRPRIGQVILQILDKYDANQDGQLDQTELATLKKDIADGKLALPAPPRGPGGPGMRQPPKEIMDKYDANKDGKLDESELAVMHQDIQDGKLAPPPFGPGRRGPGGPGGPGGLGGRGPGAPGDANSANALGGPGGPGVRGGAGGPPSAKMVLSRFDKNQDGVLDENELASFLADMKAHRPPFLGGPRDPNGPPPSDPPAQQ